MNLSRGQRAKITDLVPNGQRFTLGLGITAPGLRVDLACFGLDAQGKLSDERYMTFFNQPQTPCGGVALTTPAGDSAGFAIDLSKLPSSIARLTLTAALDGDGAMSTIAKGHVRFLDGDREVARFAFTGSDFAQERALMLLEVYRKDGVWRSSALGQGFNGGMAALVQFFGGTVAEPAAIAPPPQPAAAPPPSPAPPPSSPPDSWESDASRSSSAPAAGGGFQRLLSSLKQKTADLKTEALKFKNKEFLRAAISGSVLVAMADGTISSEEKQKMVRFIENYEPLAVFPTQELIQTFQAVVGQIDFDRDLGQAQALEALRKMRRNDGAARLIMRLILSIAAADGHVDDAERRVARQIAIELGLDPAEFELA